MQVADGERWLIEVFDDPARLSAFLNHVNLQRDQFVNIQFHALSPSLYRILLTCRVSDNQAAAREHWLDVERALHPSAGALSTGGGH